MSDPSVFGDGTTNNQLIQKPATANQAQQPPEQKYQNPQPVQQPNGKCTSPHYSILPIKRTVGLAFKCTDF